MHPITSGVGARPGPGARTGGYVREVMGSGWDRRALWTALVALGIAPALNGCVAVGYRSGGGWFVWPGSLGLIVLLLLLFLFLRGRR